MMGTAHRPQVVQIGPAAQLERPQVMHLAPIESDVASRHETRREHRAERPALRPRRQSARPAEVEHLTLTAEHHRDDVGLTRQPAYRRHRQLGTRRRMQHGAVVHTRQQRVQIDRHREIHATTAHRALAHSDQGMGQSRTAASPTDPSDTPPAHGRGTTSPPPAAGDRATCYPSQHPAGTGRATCASCGRATCSSARCAAGGPTRPHRHRPATVAHGRSPAAGTRRPTCGQPIAPAPLPALRGPPCPPCPTPATRPTTHRHAPSSANQPATRCPPQASRSPSPPSRPPGHPAATTPGRHRPPPAAGTPTAPPTKQPPPPTADPPPNSPPDDTPPTPLSNHRPLSHRCRSASRDRRSPPPSSACPAPSPHHDKGSRRVVTPRTSPSVRT
jgi:hypothetical protein